MCTESTNEKPLSSKGVIRYFIVISVPRNFEGDDGWIFWRKRAGSIIDRETDCLQ